MQQPLPEWMWRVPPPYQHSAFEQTRPPPWATGSNAIPQVLDSQHLAGNKREVPIENDAGWVRSMARAAKQPRRDRACDDPIGAPYLSSASASTSSAEQRVSSLHCISDLHVLSPHSLSSTVYQARGKEET